MTGQIEAPLRPVLAVLAIVLRGPDILLVKRKNDPEAGTWGFPGGRLEYGESIQAGACRELLEETGVMAAAGEVIGTQEVIVPSDAPGSVPTFHYILLGVLCAYQSGEPIADDDAEEALFVPVSDVFSGVYTMSKGVPKMLEHALSMRSPE